MRMRMPYFLLRRLGRMGGAPRRAAFGPSNDRADMGTEFALEASLVGWSNSFLDRRDQAPSGAAAAPAVHDEPPLKWLGQSRPQRGG